MAWKRSRVRISPGPPKLFKRVQPTTPTQVCNRSASGVRLASKLQSSTDRGLAIRQGDVLCPDQIELTPPVPVTNTRSSARWEAGYLKCESKFRIFRESEPPVMAPRLTFM